MKCQKPVVPPEINIEFVPDQHVDAILDVQLRALFAVCFTGPQDVRFQTQRFYEEMPAHRWLVREAGRVIAHAAVHDKVIGTTAGELRIGGVAEVCVRPEFRGRGLVKELLAGSDAWCAQQGMAFAVLFGKFAVYRSSGYVPVANPIRYRAGNEWRIQPIGSAMMKPLGARPWPAGEIDLRGPMF